MGFSLQDCRGNFEKLSFELSQPAWGVSLERPLKKNRSSELGPLSKETIRKTGSSKEAPAQGAPVYNPYITLYEL